MAQGNRNLKAKHAKALMQARFGLKDRPHRMFSPDTFKGKGYEEYVDAKCADRRILQRAPVRTITPSETWTLIRNGVVIA